MDAIPGLDLTAPPFDLLDDAGRERLQASVGIGFHTAGTTLIEAGTPSPHVHVILKGLVHAYQADEAGHEQRFADYGPGDVFGAWAVMAGRARLSYRADGECLSFLIPAEVFRRLIQDNPRSAAWFSEGLETKRRLSAAGADRREADELMVTRVGEAQFAPVAHVTAATSIADATAMLRECRVDCLLVDDAGFNEPGILTRTDLLDAVALQRLPLEAAVGPLASRPLVCRLRRAAVPGADRYRGGEASSRVSRKPSPLVSCRAKVRAIRCRYSSRVIALPLPPGSSAGCSTPSALASIRSNA